MVSLALEKEKKAWGKLPAIAETTKAKKVRVGEKIADENINYIEVRENIPLNLICCVDNTEKARKDEENSPNLGTLLMDVGNVLNYNKNGGYECNDIIRDDGGDDNVSFYTDYADSEEGNEKGQYCEENDYNSETLDMPEDEVADYSVHHI